MLRISGCVEFWFLFFGFIFFYSIYETILENGIFSTIKNLQMNSLICLSSANRIQVSELYKVRGKTPLRLIVGYMRGGSTLTADLVRHTEGDFYMFEPLHAISQSIRWKNTTKFLNGTERIILGDECDKVYPELLYHWFTCNFYQVDLTALTDPFISIHTPQLEGYYNCTIKKVNKSESVIDRVKRCATLLYKRCTTSRTRTIKTIRLSMFMTGKLLKWLPNLKIIYLVRDPRGILNSQFEQHVTEEKKMFTTVKKVCNAISSDISYFMELKLCHKSRIMSVVYENLCQYPLIVVSKMYQFLNIEFTKKTENFVKRMMNGPVKKCHYCTNRGNALGNAYRWIRVIEEKTLVIIDLCCSFLYSQFGYQHLEYDELNTTKVSWKPIK